jgi:hypothetical protein
MKRRQFIGMAAVGVVWTATVRGTASDALAILATPQLPGVLRDEQVVRDLGRRYRMEVPAEDDVRALTQAIMARQYTTSPLPLRARVSDQVRRDFADGTTVSLNGWILSVTEARQCALFSLLSF